MSAGDFTPRSTCNIRQKVHANKTRSGKEENKLNQAKKLPSKGDKKL